MGNRLAGAVAQCPVAASASPSTPLGALTHSTPLGALSMPAVSLSNPSNGRVDPRGLRQLAQPLAQLSMNACRLTGENSVKR